MKKAFIPAVLFALAIMRRGPEIRDEFDRALLPPLKTFHPLKVEKVPFSKEEIERLIKRFAPLIVVHQDDSSSPTSVPWYLNRTTLKARVVSRDHRKEYMQAVLEAHPKLSDLVQAPELFKEKLAPLLKEQQSQKLSIVEYFLEPDRPVESVYRGECPKSKRCLAPCYANVTMLPGVAEKTDFEVVVIQYLLFYSFQDGVSPGVPIFSSITSALKIGIHEGDWESVTVILRKEKGNPLASYVIDKVAPSQHGDFIAEGREKVTFVDDELKRTREGTHSVIYAAKNSHANYTEPIWVANSKLDSTTTLDKGNHWMCWGNPQFIGYHAFGKEPGDVGYFPSALQPGMEWIQANLRWGSTLEKHMIVPRLFMKDLDIETHGNSPGTPNSAVYLIPKQSPPERKIP